MSSQYPSLNKTIVNSSDHIKMKKQKAMYSNATQSESGFGIATNTSGDKVVVTARNYTDLLELSRGRSHCGDDGNDGAETLVNDIWAGNKTRVTNQGNDSEPSLIPFAYKGKPQYTAGNKAIPLYGFRFPHRLPINQN